MPSGGGHGDEGLNNEPTLVIVPTADCDLRSLAVAWPIRDCHVTRLHHMELDDSKLTSVHEGRFKPLSQTGGEVIKELLA